ncbi:hypothetical protein ACWCXH_00525 [Kitasatospora sp. NPDC001660]
MAAGPGGRRGNPTKRHFKALARFFQVPGTYFFEVESGDRIAGELLLGALRDAGARDVAPRAATLSPQALTTIGDLIGPIARREAEAAAPRTRALSRTLAEKESDVVTEQAERRTRR